MLKNNDRANENFISKIGSPKHFGIYITIGIALFGVFIYCIFEMPKDSKENAENLFAKFWEWRMLESPEFATFTGFHKFDDRLESYSIQAFESRKRACTEFFNDANYMLSDDQLDANTKQSLKLFAADMNTYLKGFEAKGFLFPINNLEGIQVEFERLIASMKYENADDYRKLISRLKAFPRQVSEIIDLMKEGIKLKMTNHAVSMNNVLKQLDQLLTDDLESSVLFKPALNMAETIDKAAERSALRGDIKKAITADVFPSLTRLKLFLKTEYLKHLRPNESISSLPNGEEFYLKCLHFHVGLPITPQEIHNIGMLEVQRIEKEIDKVIRKLFLNTPRTEFAQKLKDDKDTYFQSEDELIDAYKGIVFNEIHPKLPQVIKNIPSLKLSIQPAPPSMASGPSAYYLSGTPDGSRPGVFYINTAHVNTSPKYETMTLALHEAEPGHHLQCSYMMQMKDVPAFQQHIEDRRYSDAPSRFPLHTSYLEGWGLYSEYLGYELGLYEDHFLEFGHLSYEIFRACRLVVDTGIHFLGWTREKAIDYMVEKTGMHKDEISKEVDRYITWPGQACAYKIGEIKIKELRRKAETALGSQFDLRDFHDVILRNPGPLDLLEQNIDEYIQGRKANVVTLY